MCWGPGGLCVCLVPSVGVWGRWRDARFIVVLCVPPFAKLEPFLSSTFSLFSVLLVSFLPNVTQLANKSASGPSLTSVIFSFHLWYLNPHGSQWLQWIHSRDWNQDAVQLSVITVVEKGGSLLNCSHRAPADLNYCLYCTAVSNQLCGSWDFVSL